MELWDKLKRWILTGNESRKVELKQELPLNDRPSRAKLAKVVTSIANTPGGEGYIIVGVLEERHRSDKNNLEEIIVGVPYEHDAYQRLIQQALNEFTNPVPQVSYTEVLVPEVSRKIGVIVVERSRNQPHEIIQESGDVRPGIYVRRGAETFQARREELGFMYGSMSNYTVVVNFTHPLSPHQIQQIEQQADVFIADVLAPSKIPVHFDEVIPFEEQVKEIVDDVPLTDEEWQELSIIVNVPGYAVITAPLIAELHGRMGHFPKILRLRRNADDPNHYDFAEIIHLQRIRDRARERR